MNPRPFLSVTPALAAAALVAANAFPNSRSEEESPSSDWPATSAEAKPWTRWWWPGSAVDEANLTLQLEAFAAAGLGGVEITPIYGALGYEQRYVDFLSDRWIELLRHTGEEARRLGLGVDMATGTGWPFGGPWIVESDAAKKLELMDGELRQTLTRQTVKRAAPGGEGLVVDPFSKSSLRRYLQRFDSAFAEFPSELLRGHFHDSFEYYGANASPELEERFEAMHGYRLADWSDALVGSRHEEPDTLARLKADYRSTLDQLHQEFLQEWQSWARQRGWLVRNQSHGAPANLLDLYAIADIPETEVFGSTPFPIPGLRREPSAVRQGLDLPEPLVTRMASSAAHVMGKPLASSETATWLRDHWKVALSYVKPEIDRIFLDGINHIFYHGAVYSPSDAPWPGWLFYASTQFNPQNPWWRDFSALNAYVCRAQSILQRGRPDNDVLLYWPVHDIWHDPKGLAKQLTVHHVGFVTDTPFGATAKALSEAGFGIDYISDRQVKQSSGLDGGIKTSGHHYAAIVAPPTGHLPLDTLHNLLRLAEEGATVIFVELPTDVPGLKLLAERRQQLQSELEKLQLRPTDHAGLSAAAWGEGRIILGDPTLALEAFTNARPERFREAGLDFIRRQNDSGWEYFIANLGRTDVQEWFELGVPANSAQLLDPLDGHAGAAALRQTENGKTAVYLQVKAGQSIVLSAASASAEAEAGSTSTESWPYYESAGPVIDLSGEWQLDFLVGGPELPDSTAVSNLGSWTDLEDPKARSFAGTARYTLDFDLPASKYDDWLLHLGDLRESARVSINGQFVQTIWSLPFETRIGKWLRPGRNTLSLEVTNTAANRIRAMDRQGENWKIMREINFVDINYRPFDASNWEIEPAGLLGPVTLQGLSNINPTTPSAD